MVFGDPLHGLTVIETNMRGVSDVVPVGEGAIVFLELGHDPKPTMRAQHAVQPVKFQSGEKEMLGGFRACDEVIGMGEHLFMGSEKGIIAGHLMAMLLKNQREGRGRATPIIKPPSPGFDTLQEGSGQAAQEGTVFFVGGVVAVQSVALDFFLWPQALLGGQISQSAGLTAEVI